MDENSRNLVALIGSSRKKKEENEGKDYEFIWRFLGDKKEEELGFGFVYLCRMI